MKKDKRAKNKANVYQKRMNDTEPKKHEEVGVFHIVVLILSIVLLGILVADTAINLPKQISDVLQTLDTLICVVFLIEFGIRFYKAESKLAFMMSLLGIDGVMRVRGSNLPRWTSLRK